MTATACPTPVLLMWEHLGARAAEDGRPTVLERGAIRSPCKRWACAHCGTGKRAEAAKFITAGARHGVRARPRQRLRFVTITYGRDRDLRFNRPEDVKQSSEDWRRFVQLWRRQGRELEYVRVLEKTKRGRIHIHAITWGDWLAKCTNKGRRARGLPTGPGSGSPCYCTDERPCIQRLAWRAGFGWVEVRQIKSPERAVAYVAKYLGKQTAADWPRHARRVSYSRRFADGLTLGDIHAGWIAAVRERLAELGTLEELPTGPLRWEHVTHPGELTDTRAPPRPETPLDRFGRPFNCHTGELLA